MPSTIDAQVGPDLRRTGRVIVIFSVLLAVTMLVVPCAVIAVGGTVMEIFAAG